MIIDIDMGNTLIKWRCSGDSRSTFFNDVNELPEQWQGLPDTTRFRISSVRSAKETRGLCARLNALGFVSVDIAVVTNELNGVVLAYRDVASFGVDRWLALLAARSRHPGSDCVVIHAGTALVADFLRADGTHLGGYITAGWSAALRSLGGAAPALKPGVEGVADSRRVHPGATTLECVEAGMSLLFSGFINELMRSAASCLKSPVWLFAGGDADKMLCFYESLQQANLAEAFRCGTSEYAPSLVLDGLAVALP